MKISQKIHISFIFISILSVVLTAMLLTYIVEKNTKNVMEEQIKKQYVAIKETTKHQLSDYLNIIENEVLTLANLQMTRKAMERFFDAYKVLSASNETNLGEFQRLTEYYLNDFKSGFSRHDHDNMSPVDFMNKITPNQLFLQSMYVNPSPQMLSNDNKALPVLTKSNYVKTHEEFHFDLMGYQERFEFDDIYLIDRTGNIVYSVSKKIDFATNLLTGPLSKSGLGRVYQKAKTISKGDIVFQDFSPYYPSHNTPSSFIATPIMETNKLVGVLAFQLPLDHINSIMLHDANWDGFGKTGEIFLVSDDKSLRSQRRQLVENKVNYLEGLAKKGMSEQNIQKIADNNSSALYEKSQTEATKRALAGESGVGVFTNNRGEQFFSAYTPVSFFGESWAIISEIDYQEGVSSLEKISKELYTAAFYVMGIILFFAIVFSWILARGVSKPITLLSKKIGGIADKHDLSLRLKVVGDDEVKKLAEAVNSMLSDFQSVIKESDATIKVLTEASDQITNSLTMMQEEVENQAAKSSQCAAAITEMSSSIAQVASNAEAASESSESVVLSIQDSAYVGGELVDKINQLSAQMKQATESIDRLCAESSSIDIVLDVIQDIAEQTNLLALNAAIEAARAGEQGRGFTVVAAEVRTLATRTQSSTEQIRSKVEALQLETDKVVESIKDANLFVDTSVEHCVASNEKLDKVVTLMKRISEMNTEIATAANQQAGVTDSISENINKIVHYANEVVNQTHRTDDISRDINKQADTLSKQIGQFRIA